MELCLNGVNEVKQFVHSASLLELGQCTLSSGRYVVCPTSIMGVLSLDLSKPVVLDTSNLTEKQLAAVRKELSDLIVK